jgi:hypothetical protein
VMLAAAEAIFVLSVMGALLVGVAAMRSKT